MRGLVLAMVTVIAITPVHAKCADVASNPVAPATPQADLVKSFWSDCYSVNGLGTDAVLAARAEGFVTPPAVLLDGLTSRMASFDGKPTAFFKAAEGELLVFLAGDSTKTEFSNQLSHVCAIAAFTSAEDIAKIVAERLGPGDPLKSADPLKYRGFQVLAFKRNAPQPTRFNPASVDDMKAEFNAGQIGLIAARTDDRQQLTLLLLVVPAKDPAPEPAVVSR